jgi:N-acetylmuramoyl-L-alanine amidase
MIWALLAALAVGTAEPAFLVVVDPGHGGEKHGAAGPGGLTEKQIALQIARRVASHLARQGGRVILTRTGDTTVSLDARAALANLKEVDLFLSIHLNSMPTPAARRATQGIETYFLSADASDAAATEVAERENADRLAGEPEPGADPVANILEDLDRTETLARSSRLAQALHERLVVETGAEDRGVKQAPFIVLAGARMPAVLLEVGFLSHPEEGRRLADRAYQERVAKAIAAGVAIWRSPRTSAVNRPASR